MAESAFHIKLICTYICIESIKTVQKKKRKRKGNEGQMGSRVVIQL